MRAVPLHVSGNNSMWRMLPEGCLLLWPSWPDTPCPASDPTQPDLTRPDRPDPTEAGYRARGRVGELHVDAEGPSAGVISRHRHPLPVGGAARHSAGRLPQGQ